MTHVSHENSPHEGAPVASPASNATISFSLTPGKLFFLGFLFGALVMMIPTAIQGTKVFFGTSSARGAGGNALLGNPSPTPTAAAAPTPQPTPAALKPVSGDDHIFGNKDAKVTIIEYSDIECPYCKRFHPTVAKVIDEYKGKVNWVYRHFPLDFHANAQSEAEATECAAELGGNDAFWKYINTMFDRTTSGGTGFAKDALAPLAKEIGLDDKKFKECLDSGKYKTKVQQQTNEGQSAGIQGTPGGFVIAKDGKSSVIEGAIPAAALKSQIDALLR